MTENLINRISFYLASGGLFNPELADHIAVRTLLFECREALAQPEQEPVAKYSDIVSDGGLDPRNTTTPQRTWVGLTEEDLKLLSAEWRIVYGAWMDDFARDIEARLKDLNT